MDILEAVTFTEAARLLKCHEATIARLAKSGHLERFGGRLGGGGRRQITVRSIRTYQEGQGPIWRKENVSAPSVAVGVSPGTKSASAGGRERTTNTASPAPLTFPPIKNRWPGNG
jgi:hypothetical protein